MGWRIDHAATIQFKLQQLVKQIVGGLAAAVREDLAAGEHGEGQPAELFDDPHALQPGIDIAGTPQLGQSLEVIIAGNQIVADPHQGIAKAFVSTADQRGGVIDLVALVASGEQAGAAGDGVGIDVVLDRPHLTGEVGRGDDVNAWNGEQQEIGGLDETAGDLPFQSRDLLGFLGEIVVQVCQDPLSHQGLIGRGTGVLGPGQDAEQRRAVKPESLLLEQLRESRGAGHDDLLGGGEVPSHGHGQGPIPELAAMLAEQVREAGQVEMHVLADLTAQGDSLVYEVASMADQQLELAVAGFKRLLGQSETDDGRAVQGREINVVGLDTGMIDLTKLLGGEGMHYASIEACPAKATLDGRVIVARAFDGDEHVAETVLLNGLTDALEHALHSGSGVLHDGRRHENLGIEIREHPLRACLGAVDSDDPEAFRSDLLDAVVDFSVGFEDRLRLCGGPS